MMFKTAEEAFRKIESFTNLEKSPNLTAREYRLDRMFALLELFNNPQNAFKSIHVAGSKGKGSTAAFIASVLSANGLKTGLYCSPHVETYKERISLSGTFFDDALYAETASMMLEKINQSITDEDLSGGAPTTFELLTLLSFLIFKESRCEWAVFETGLGGRLDATNVITPAAVVLTIIELEHTEYLGNTITAVAGEKAGIIKAGVPVFCAAQTADAEAVFRSRAAELGCEIYFPSDLISKIVKNSADKPDFQQSFSLTLTSGSSFNIRLRSAGSFQVENASLAVCCLETLRQRPETTLPNTFDSAAGIELTTLPGRMEMFKTSGGQTVMLDGAHTIRSVNAAADALFESTGAKDAVLLFGAVEGKDVEGMAEMLCRRFSRIIISTPGTFKKSNPDAVFKIFSKKNVSVLLKKNAAEALLEAFNAVKGTGDPVFVTGSFYMVADIRKLLNVSIDSNKKL